MTTNSVNQITGHSRTAGNLGQQAVGRGDLVNEAYLKGIAERLALAALMNRDEAQLMTRWGQILAAQHPTSDQGHPRRHALTDPRSKGR